MRPAWHAIIRLDTAAWPALLEAAIGSATLPALAEWARAGHPLIARRATCGDAAGSVPLGLPLPPSLGKHRLGFAVAPNAIVSNTPPPLLGDLIETAPSAWRPTLAALVGTAPAVRCFGSLAWEYLTGLRYLTPSSDVDLLWHCTTYDEADRLTQAILAIAADAPMRIDGEIVAPTQLAVQWREWASGAADLLAKTPNETRMVLRADVFA